MQDVKLKSNFKYNSCNVYIFFVLLFLVQLLLFVFLYKKENNLYIEIAVCCVTSYLTAIISLKKVIISNNSVTFIYYLRVFKRKVIIPYRDIKKVKYINALRSPEEWYFYPKKRKYPYFFMTSHLMSKIDLKTIFNFLKENGIEIIIKGRKLD